MGSEVREYFETDAETHFLAATDQLALILSSGVLDALGPEETSTVVSPLFALGRNPHRSYTALYTNAGVASHQAVPPL
jgi:hypothetical protein